MAFSDLEAKIEAILFTMGEAVELNRIAIATGYTEDECRQTIKDMMEKYRSENRGVQLIELDGAFQMCTKSEMYETLLRIAHVPKKQVLTDVLLETLSIIAYKQPITRTEIEKIRGVKCDHAISKLSEYNLITDVGRLDAPGRPLLFGTTEEFLRQFGVASIDDLPSLNVEKMEDFKQEAEEEVQLKLNI